MTKYQKTNDGKLISHAWPGGYPVYYIMGDGGTLCPKCANGENGSAAYLDEEGTTMGTDPQWEICAQEIHWEGEPLICDHCNGEIESAYGGDSKE